MSILQSTNIVTAAYNAIVSDVDAIVERNADAPISPTIDGHIIIRDAAPNIEDGTLGATHTFYLHLEIPIEIYMIGSDTKDRAERLSLLSSDVRTSLLTDSSLLALVNFLDVLPSEVMTFSEDGARSVDASALTLVVEYDSTIGIG
jgi:hypothetical protein